MKNEKKHTEHNADLEKILNEFSDDERTGAMDFWQQSSLARETTNITSEKEVEEALQNVHFRINQEKTSNENKSTILTSVVSSARYLVAAIALIVFGFGVLMIPKTITVPNAEVAVIELPDGSSVEMNSGSSVRYNRLFAITNRNITLNGEAFFSVEADDQPFIINANGSAVEVTGTEFNIRSWASDPGSETTVTVTEGDVTFYPAGKKLHTVVLEAGQTSQFNANISSPTIPKASTDEHLAWREKRMVFQETPLIVILNDLERSFDVEIEWDVDDMDYETLTAYYNQPAKIETILEDICTVKGLRYTRTTSGYRIFK